MRFTTDITDRLRRIARRVTASTGPRKRRGRRGRKEGQTQPPEEYVFTAKATVHRVVDGDTWIGMRKPDPMTIIPRSGYRLDDIDTHELNSSDNQRRTWAYEEKMFVENFVEQGRREWDGGTGDDGLGPWPFLVAFTDPTDEIPDYGGPQFEGTYGRAIADLVRRSDGRSLKQALLDEFGDRVNPKAGGDRS